MPKDFGTTLMEERTSAGKTMGDLARALQVSVAYISKVESAKAPPFTRERVLEAASFLGVNPVRLLVAAATGRSSHVLPAYHSELATRVATALARGAPDWTDEQFRSALRDAGLAVEEVK